MPLEEFDIEKKAVIERALKACSKVNLTDWEEGFVEDISIQFEKKGYLSEKQLGRLRIIWKERVKDQKEAK